MGGKKKKTTIGYSYYMGLFMGLCRGPVDAIRQIRVGDKLAWAGEAKSNQSIYIDAPGLFGGEEQEGGVQGTLQIMMGAKDQPRNDSLAAMLGGLVSAFRGVTTTFFDGLVCAMSPYPKEWSYLVQKTKAGWHDGVCWYPEKCEVVAITGEIYAEDLAFSASKATTDGSFAGIEINGVKPTDLIIINKPPGLTYRAWSAFAYDADPFAKCLPWTNWFSVTDAQGVTTEHWHQWYATIEQAQASALNRNVVLSGSTSYKIWLYDTPVEDNRDGLSLRVFKGGVIGMNPAHILRRLYTDPRIGRGLNPELRLDEASWLAAADRFYEEGMGLCMKWSRTGSLSEFAGEVINHAGAAVYTSRRTGKIVLKPIRGDYDIDDLPLFTPDSGLLGIDDDQSSAQMSGVNEVVVKWTDVLNKKEAAVRERNLGAVMAAGGVTVSEEVSYPGIPTDALARRIARRDLQAKSGIKRLTVRLDRRGKDIMPGHVFRVSDPIRGIQNMVLRAGRVEFGTITDGTVTVTALQDVFGLPATVYRSPEENAYTPPDATPRPPSLQAVMETPYRELVQALSNADLAALPEDACYLSAMAAKPGGLAESFSFAVCVTPGAFTVKAEAGAWCPGGTLAAAIGPLNTQITLQNGSALENIAVGTAALLDQEIVRIDAIDASTGTLTIARGCVDTLPVAHAKNAMLLCYDNWGADDPTEYLPGVSVQAKLLTRTASGMLPEGAALTQPMTFQGRAARPYPPGDVRIDGALYPLTIRTGSVITWVSRNRLLQADKLIAWGAPSVTAEPGTTYTVAIYNHATNVRLVELDGLTATEAVVPSIDLPDVTRLEVYSVRGGMESWQRFSHVLRLADLAPRNLRAYVLE